MLKSVKGTYNQGKITLEENPDDIPPETKVIVTFLTNSQDSQQKQLTEQVYDDLDYLAGTWTEDDEAEFLENTSHFNQV